MTYSKRESIEPNSEFPRWSKILGRYIFFLPSLLYFLLCGNLLHNLAAGCIVPVTRSTRQNALLSRPVTFDPCYRGVGPLGIKHPNCVRAPFGSFYMDLCTVHFLAFIMRLQNNYHLSAARKFMAN